ncbi:MAG: TonB C-terminal domain-containing protein [Acidobacteria bacterium]|nr:TonB C-terminal domain-containing protein [Acidobacteriota bacterium]
MNTLWRKVSGSLLLLCLTMAAALAAQVRIKAFFSSSFTDTEYQQRVIAKVNANWQSSGEMAAAGSKTIIVLKCDRNGAVNYQKVYRSSGNRTFDGDAEACLNRSAPFPPLPPAYRDPYLEIHFHFLVEE